MRTHGRLACLGLLVLAACAEVPVQPAPAPAAVAKAPRDAAIEAAIADHRRAAQQRAQAGDHPAAAREWRIVLLLAPGDEAARAGHDAAQAAIHQGVRDHLQAGRAALKSGDAERATVAMLRVLALDPGNAEAAKALRDIDRQKLARIQSGRAARAAQASATAGATRAAAAPAVEAADSYDLEQRLEIFRAGDVAGGLRELRAYVDANPRNDVARQRTAAVVYERSLEAEGKGARDQALMLCEQAIALRGRPVPEWSARAQTLRRALADEKAKR